MTTQEQQPLDTPDALEYARSVIYGRVLRMLDELVGPNQMLQLQVCRELELDLNSHAIGCARRMMRTANPPSQAAIGRALGVSRQRAHQIIQGK